MNIKGGNAVIETTQHFPDVCLYFPKLQGKTVKQKVAKEGCQFLFRLK